MRGFGPIDDDGEMTTVTYTLQRVARIESVQTSVDGDQVALWFTDSNNKLICLVPPAGVSVSEMPQPMVN